MKNILVLNCGSSSIKFQLIVMPNEKVVIKGLIEKIGNIDSSFSSTITKKENIICENHKLGIEFIIKYLVDKEVIDGISSIHACGHRVAHGGEYFKDSVMIDDYVIKMIEEASTLAPLHNPKNIAGYKESSKLLPNALQVAMFDTAFHQTLDESAYIYPIPYEYYRNHKVRKYGFHGTSFQYVSCEVYKKFKKSVGTMIICHLGNGASICAIKDGKSIDTSMGLSPLAGIMMGTRSGNVDPAIIEYIGKKEKLSLDIVIDILNQKSGLLGVSDLSNNMRKIDKAIVKGNKQAKLAQKIFVKRIVDYIGSYTMQLGKVDALVFTAGIGENCPTIRKLVIDGVKVALGIEIEQSINENINSEFTIISSKNSKVTVCVVATNEEIMIARETYKHLVD